MARVLKRAGRGRKGSSNEKSKLWKRKLAEISLNSSAKYYAVENGPIMGRYLFSHVPWLAASRGEADYDERTSCSREDNLICKASAEKQKTVQRCFVSLWHLGRSAPKGTEPAGLSWGFPPELN